MSAAAPAAAGGGILGALPHAGQPGQGFLGGMAKGAFGAPAEGGMSSTLGQFTGQQLMGNLMPGGGRPPPPMQAPPPSGPATKGKQMLGGLMHPNAAKPQPPMGAPQRPRVIGQQALAAPMALSSFTGNLDYDYLDPLR